MKAINEKPQWSREPIEFRENIELHYISQKSMKANNVNKAMEAVKH